MSAKKIVVQNLTRRKEMIDEYAVKFVREYFTNTCRIWKSIQQEAEKRTSIISNSFAEKWVEHTLKCSAQILGAIENDDVRGIVIVHQCRRESELTLITSLLKTLAESTFKLGLSVGAVKKYLWTLKHIKKELDEIFESKTFFWLLHPSPVSYSTQVTTRFIEYFIGVSKTEKICLAHEVHSLEQVQVLESFGFEMRKEIAFVFSEKLDSETSLPTFDSSDPPLKVWLMIFDPAKVQVLHANQKESLLSLVKKEERKGKESRESREITRNVVSPPSPPVVAWEQQREAIRQPISTSPSLKTIVYDELPMNSEGNHIEEQFQSDLTPSERLEFPDDVSAAYGGIPSFNDSKESFSSVVVKKNPPSSSASKTNVHGSVPSNARGSVPSNDRGSVPNSREAYRMKHDPNYGAWNPVAENSEATKRQLASAEIATTVHEKPNDH